MIGMVVHRRDLRETLIRVIGLLTKPKPPGALLSMPDTSQTI